jgi:hypothetical protein
MTAPKPPSQPECEWVEECIEVCDADPVFVEEKGVRATFLNPRRDQIRKIHYDGCYNKIAGICKADYIVCLPGVVDVVVELKGSHSNLKHALEQVASTLEDWTCDPKCSAKPVALIVYGAIQTRDDLPRRRPKANSSIQCMEGEFRSRFKGRFHLFVHESGEKKFRFSDFLRKHNAN